MIKYTKANASGVTYYWYYVCHASEWAAQLHGLNRFMHIGEFVTCSSPVPVYASYVELSRVFSASERAKESVKRITGWYGAAGVELTSQVVLQSLASILRR